MNELSSKPTSTIIEWANEALQLYKKQAESINDAGKDLATSFYCQSPLNNTEDCQMLVYGINPGAGSPYSKWINENCIDENYLLNGNPIFHNKKDKEIIEILNGQAPDSKGWALYKRLHSMLSCAGKQSILYDVRKFALENLVLFGTTKENLIPKGVDIQESAKHSLKLIPIIKPKVVVLLGAQCRKQFSKIKQLEPVVDGLVWSTEYEGIAVVAIPHTACFYTSEAICVCGKVLGLALEGEKITSAIVEEKFKNEIDLYIDRRGKKSHSRNNFDQSEVMEDVCSTIGLDPYDDANNRYKLDGTYGVTVTDKQNGYIAIRRIEENKMIDGDKLLRDYLKNRGYHTDQNAWIGYKNFNEFGGIEGKDESEIAEKIILEINEVTRDLKNM